MTLIKIFLIAFGSFIALDAVWFLTVSRGLYQRAIGPLMLEHANFAAAFVVYLLLALGVTFFVIMPGLRAGLSITHIVLSGALLGLVTYGVYDFTNLSVLKGWPLWISLVDIAWGAFASGVVTLVTVYIAKTFF